MKQSPGHDRPHPCGLRVGMSCCLQECDRFHGLKTTQEKHRSNQQKLQQDPAHLPHLQGVLLFYFFHFTKTFTKTKNEFVCLGFFFFKVREENKAQTRMG